MAKKLSKEDVRGPDTFIAFSDRAIAFIEKNRNALFGFFGVAFFAGLSVIIFEQVKISQEMDAQADLFTATRAFDVQAQKLNPLPTEASEKAPQEINKTPDQLKKDYESVIPKYKYVIDTHPGSKAARMASIDLADLYSQYNDHASAKEVLQTISEKTSQKDFFYGLLHMQLGHSLTELDDCKSAITAYDKITQAPAQTHLHAQALLRMGLCYEKDGDVAAAKETYQRISDEFGESQAARNAKNQLRLLTINGKENS